MNCTYDVAHEVQAAKRLQLGTPWQLELSSDAMEYRGFLILPNLSKPKNL